MGYVDVNAEPEDLIIVYPDYDLKNVFDYYSNRTGIDKASPPGGTNAFTEGGMNTLRKATQGHDRVWLIVSESAGSGEPLKEDLARSYTLVHSREYNLIETTLWTKRK